jgi:hypothetical protein
MPEGSNFMVICQGGSKCMGVGRKSCKLYRSGPLGAKCNFGENHNDECEFGTFCDPILNVCTDAKFLPPFQCLGASRNCSNVMNEECVCMDPSNPGKGTCYRSWTPNECDFDRIRNQYRDCSRRYNCAYEKNFLFSFLADSLSKDTCLGKNCGYIAKNFLCCAMSPMKADPYSWATSMPLDCVNERNLGATLMISLLIFFSLSAGIAGTVFLAIYFVVRYRHSLQYQDIE